MPSTQFDTIILIGRPASGKSEIIDYLLKTPLDERRSRFRVGDLHFVDDFPMLWAWFEEDHILAEKFNRPRLHTDDEGYFLYEDLWHLLIERIDLDFQKLQRDRGEHDGGNTTIVEFARGSEHGGYEAAFAHLSAQLLQSAAILYVNVTFEESLRKNRRRFNPDRPDSILEHGLPDDKLTRLYRDDDWLQYSGRDASYLRVGELDVPYILFDNEDDVTSGAAEKLGERLEERLDQLWQLHVGRRAK